MGKWGYSQLTSAGKGLFWGLPLERSCPWGLGRLGSGIEACFSNSKALIMAPQNGCLLATPLVLITLTEGQGEALRSSLSEATWPEGPGAKFAYRFVVKACVFKQGAAPPPGTCGEDDSHPRRRQLSLWRRGKANGPWL